LKKNMGDYSSYLPVAGFNNDKKKAKDGNDALG
jgi:hypothetical protein